MRGLRTSHSKAFCSFERDCDEGGEGAPSALARMGLTLNLTSKSMRRSANWLRFAKSLEGRFAERMPGRPRGNLGANASDHERYGFVGLNLGNRGATRSEATFRSFSRPSAEREGAAGSKRGFHVR